MVLSADNNTNVETTPLYGQTHKAIHLLCFFSFQIPNTLLINHSLLEAPLQDGVFLQRRIFSTRRTPYSKFSPYSSPKHLRDLIFFISSAMASSTDFNPFEQSFILYEADGTPFNVTIPELDAFVFYNDQICITYGAQIGASIVLFIVLLLLTKRDKRTSVIFIINALALLLNIIRMVCASIYFTGPFIETYAYFSQDFSQVHAKDKAVSVVSATFTALMLLCVETSLCLQARVVCITLRPIYRNVIFSISILIALVAVAFRFALCIENNILIVQAAAEESLNWLANATDIATTVSICSFCAIFVTKLGFALYQRKKLGLVQFGPMQILFIMGCQTLVIPGSCIPCHISQN